MRICCERGPRLDPKGKAAMSPAFSVLSAAEAWAPACLWGGEGCKVCICDSTCPGWG